MANTDEQDNEIFGAFTAPDPVTYTAEPDGTNVVLPKPDLQSGQSLQSLLDAYMEKLGKPEDIIKKSDDPFDRPSFNVKTSPEESDRKVLNQFMDIMSIAESDSGKDLIQDYTIFDDNMGKGTGYFQWETGLNQGAGTRISSAHFNTKEKSPDWLVDLVNKTSYVSGGRRNFDVKQDDIMNLNKEQQYYIQGRYIMNNPEGQKFFNQFKNANDSDSKLDAVAEYWVDEHWGGHKGDLKTRADKKKWFLEQVGYGPTNRVFNAIKSIGEGF